MIAEDPRIYFENEFKGRRADDRDLLSEVRTVFRNRRGKLEVHPARTPARRWARQGSWIGPQRRVRRGTGSFLDQQALRMDYSREEIGSIVCTANCAARIAGRCSVFAKSDMIHAQQKGYTPPEILRGCATPSPAIFRSSIVKAGRCRARWRSSAPSRRTAA